ncbi:hypothetical protein HN011_003281 [Eciton burchellii]|nr:hypothetical protein HN011_003281 [Eciton burchellii]
MFRPPTSTSSGLFADNTCSTRRVPRTVHRRMPRWPRESSLTSLARAGTGKWAKFVDKSGQIKRSIACTRKETAANAALKFLRKRSRRRQEYRVRLDSEFGRALSNFFGRKDALHPSRQTCASWNE